MSTRDELANLIDDAAEWATSQGRICSPHEVADAILAAGWHPPVRGETWEWAVEGDKPEPWVMDDHGIKSREDAEAAAERVRTDWPAVDPTARVVRRLVGPWEVA
ncbi:hypothetical protein [Prescottella equi]|uniref:hypothetical protein n=1 Tax=Rhodococcus hoagii TaxID=43767 RepID=UPI000A10177B|nr:hypothetical protein [Prescottella equi]NKR90571.1 hypothetical protein [Prescottella equi]ORJ99852.1 hypothetical protein A6F58_00650 [Prescottella equi]